MSEHTKGEWHSVGWAVKDSEGKNICTLTQNHNYTIDAHHIVDCVNGCEGINPKAVKDLYEALAKAKEE
ncbi:MAG: hypothetical protein JRE40_15140 [Deltaproteobacteria bacterium]|nr:hypothetical protein [Deltaproteobacteria bacterium]